tara:strand:- start:2249 stop:2488 length:240 start_codon:yes stop_codon:yes gene_type:complete
MKDLDTRSKKIAQGITADTARLGPIVARAIVKDWSEACRRVDDAVNHEAERLMDEGNLSPGSFLKAEMLRAAWRRIQNG